MTKQPVHPIHLFEKKGLKQIMSVYFTVYTASKQGLIWIGHKTGLQVKEEVIYIR